MNALALELAGRRRRAEARDATHDVRMVWLRRFVAGEITRAELEAELARIRRDGLATEASQGKAV